MDTSHRIEELRRSMADRDIALCLITRPDDQHYLSGFKAIVYSRPIDLVITPEQVALVVPALEEVHDSLRGKKGTHSKVKEALDRPTRTILRSTLYRVTASLAATP